MIERLNRPERLDFLPLSFNCRAAEGFALENPYSDLHGGFGLMLHAHYRLVYEELFGELADSSGTARAYVLRPGTALLSPVAENQTFTFVLVLFGPSVRHGAACAEALGQLGINGVTRARHKFTVEGIERLAPEGNMPLWTADAGWNVRAIQPVSAPDLLRQVLAPGRWRIELLTPLAVKHENGILRAGLTARIFCERVLGRAQFLVAPQPGGPLFDAGFRRDALIQADAITLTDDSTAWLSQSRYSARQRQRSDFGGLTGHFTLAGDTGPVGGWLRLAEWLHVGSKTSFGLGAFRLRLLD